MDMVSDAAIPGALAVLAEAAINAVKEAVELFGDCDLYHFGVVRPD
jgi:hypothetical protein